MAPQNCNRVLSSTLPTWQYTVAWTATSGRTPRTPGGAADGTDQGTWCAGSGHATVHRCRGQHGQYILFQVFDGAQPFVVLDVFVRFQAQMVAGRGGSPCPDVFDVGGWQLYLLQRQSKVPAQIQKTSHVQGTGLFGDRVERAGAVGFRRAAGVPMGITFEQHRERFLVLLPNVFHLVGQSTAALPCAPKGIVLFLLQDCVVDLVVPPGHVHARGFFFFEVQFGQVIQIVAFDAPRAQTRQPVQRLGRKSVLCFRLCFCLRLLRLLFFLVLFLIPFLVLLVCLFFLWHQLFCYVFWGTTSGGGTVVLLWGWQNTTAGSRYKRAPVVLVRCTTVIIGTAAGVVNSLLTTIGTAAIVNTIITVPTTITTVRFVQSLVPFHPRHGFPFGFTAFRYNGFSFCIAVLFHQTLAPVSAAAEHFVPFRPTHTVATQHHLVECQSRPPWQQQEQNQ